MDDLDGLNRLAERLPVAWMSPCRHTLRGVNSGRDGATPSSEGDPRPLLRQLQRGGLLMLSTAFETGIGFRWLAFMSRLQWQGRHPRTWWRQVGVLKVLCSVLSPTRSAAAGGAC